MRKFYFGILCLLLSSSAFSQNQGWCGFDAYMKERMKDPAFAESIKKMDNIMLSKGQNGKSAASVVIPTVVHVMHKYGAENISNAQIEDGIRVLNEDYSRLNPDTTNTRAQFLPYAANPDIEFRLACIDPNGDPTEGITRHYTTMTDEADNPIKNIEPYAHWPYNEYFNIWVVEEITIGGSGLGRVLGRAVFPNDPLASTTYGFLVVNDYFGTIGTASSSDSRTASHEIGHCLGLWHTFETFNGNNCNTGSCSSDGDRCCDTPPSFEATFNCVTSQNTCNNDATGSPYVADGVDQIENYMSYDDGCQNMFTIEQVARMNSSLSSYSYLSNLISPGNLAATGTNDGYVCVEGKPIIDFDFDVAVGCEGSFDVEFTDYSYNDIDSTNWTYAWDFGDGGSSSAKNPIHSYTTFGTYDVTLDITNTTGTGTLTKTQIVDVRAASGGQTAPFNEGYELNSNFPEDISNARMNWIIENSSSSTWTRKVNASGKTYAYTGNASVGIKCSSVPDGFKHGMVSPTIDMTGLDGTCDTLKFNYAYAQVNTNNDILQVSLSADCGVNWDLKWTKFGTQLKTANPQSSGEFIPEADEWALGEIPISAFYKANTNVRVKFELTSDRGNYLYIDDINFGCKTLGVNNLENTLRFNIFPNPSNGDATININSTAKQTVTIDVVDLVGKKVSSNTINLNANQNSFRLETVSGNLEKGVYIINVHNSKGIVTERFIKY